MESPKIPDIVVSRLPLYLQTLNHLLREGKEVISSNEMSEWVGVPAVQIRKDLSFFGGLGKQGSGYNIIFLIDSLRGILHLNQIWPIAIVGVGNLGQALMRYQGFARQGFEIVLALDNNPHVIGTEIAGILVRDVEEMEAEISRLNVKIAVLTVPASVAQSTADALVSYGIRAILNYAPIILKVPVEVRVANIDPVLKLEQLTYYLS
jgi:redox-sensing transcriptional repressor